MYLLQIKWYQIFFQMGAREEATLGSVPSYYNNIHINDKITKIKLRSDLFQQVQATEASGSFSKRKRAIE